MLKQLLAADSEPVPYRFSVENWRRLGEAGIFDEEDRVELLDGKIIIMPPTGRRHWQAHTNLNELFVEQSKRRYMVGPGNLVNADDYSEPQPDLILAARPGQTAGGNPSAADLFLVVEISDSSLRHARKRKLRKYAICGVPECWIVNLADDQIEVFRQPIGEDYAEKRVLRAGQEISPAAFPDVVIGVSEIIPAR